MRAGAGRGEGEFGREGKGRVKHPVALFNPLLLRLPCRLVFQGGLQR